VAAAAPAGRADAPGGGARSTAPRAAGGVTVGTLFVSGLSHWKAPIALREQLALDGDKVREVLADVFGWGALTEIMLISTCNRVEVYGVAEVPADAGARVFEHLCRQRGVDFATVEETLYSKMDTDAVIHAFRVAASLDSMVVGESQILGQVKDAFTTAQTCQTLGPTLHQVWSRAFAVAKKVRTETGLGRLAVSVPSAAVELARKIFDGLEGHSVLLVGAGEMGELAARHLVEQGAFPIYVANRTPQRAQELARALAGTAVPFEDLETTMAAVDIVLTSTDASKAIIGPDAVQRVMHARRSRPLFFVDISVPRNVDAGVNQLANVFYYDIDHLQHVVDANLREREREAHRAEAIVKTDVERLMTAWKDQEIVPTIVSLRERLETIRHQEVVRALARLPDASPETRQTVEALSHAIVNKILHAPITKLRESSRSGHGGSWTAFVHELFGLRRDG
jgi:glutamyl-tRNA reductase